MGLRDSISAFGWLRRGVAELRLARKALERSATAAEELCILVARATGQGLYSLAPNPEPDGLGGEFIAQTDSEFAEMEALERELGRDIGIDEEISTLPGAEWLE